MYVFSILSHQVKVDMLKDEMRRKSEVICRGANIVSQLINQIHNNRTYAVRYRVATINSVCKVMSTSLELKSGYVENDSERKCHVFFFQDVYAKNGFKMNIGPKNNRISSETERNHMRKVSH